MSHPDFRLRVFEEKMDLDDKIGRLGAFIGNATFAGLDPVDQDLLRAQRSAMLAYSELLGQRLERFATAVA